MRTARWFELWSGLAAGGLGLLIIALVLFGPIYQTASQSCSKTSTGTTCSNVLGWATSTQVNHGIPPLALIYFIALAVVLLSLVASTLLHWRSGSRIWRRFLWATTLLLVLVSLAGFDLAILMVPSILLALGAAGAASSGD